MTLGFSGKRLRELKEHLVGWELYQVQIDKYHVMFWFENGWCLLNVAYRFSFRSGSIDYVYDVQAPGDRKALNVDSILRRPITAVEASSDRELQLVFDNGDTLIIHDSPTMRSAWFCRYDSTKDRHVLWAMDDDEFDD